MHRSPRLAQRPLPIHLVCDLEGIRVPFQDRLCPGCPAGPVDEVRSSEVALYKLATRELSQFEEVLEIPDRCFEDFLAVAERHREGVVELARRVERAAIDPDGECQRDGEAPPKDKGESELCSHLRKWKRARKERNEHAVSMSLIALRGVTRNLGRREMSHDQPRRIHLTSSMSHISLRSFLTSVPSMVFEQRGDDEALCNFAGGAGAHVAASPTEILMASIAKYHPLLRMQDSVKDQDLVTIKRGIREETTARRARELPIAAIIH